MLVDTESTGAPAAASPAIGEKKSRRKNKAKAAKQKTKKRADDLLSPPNVILAIAGLILVRWLLGILISMFTPDSYPPPPPPPPRFRRPPSPPPVPSPPPPWLIDPCNKQGTFSSCYAARRRRRHTHRSCRPRRRPAHRRHRRRRHHHLHRRSLHRRRLSRQPSRRWPSRRSRHLSACRVLLLQRQSPKRSMETTARRQKDCSSTNSTRQRTSSGRGEDAPMELHGLVRATSARGLALDSPPSSSRARLWERAAGSSPARRAASSSRKARWSYAAAMVATVGREARLMAARASIGAQRGGLRRAMYGAVESRTDRPTCQRSSPSALHLLDITKS